jgi:hypothetical protein
VCLATWTAQGATRPELATLIEVVPVDRAVAPPPVPVVVVLDVVLIDDRALAPPAPDVPASDASASGLPASGISGALDLAVSVAIGTHCLDAFAVDRPDPEPRQGWRAALRARAFRVMER